MASLLASYQDAPLIGIEFVVEVRRPGLDQIYFCYLCNRQTDRVGLIPCLISAKHRLAFLRRYFPTASAKFDQRPDTAAWQQSAYDRLESVVHKIEVKFGRMAVEVFDEQAEGCSFADRKQKVLDRIEDGMHFRESDDLNFAGMGDPFPMSVCADATRQPEDLGLDHIQDPGHKSLMEREILR